ncbi:hypothetical protein Gotur_032476 [Gossypium turneri]
MNSFKTRTFGMLRSYWSTMILSRCTRRIECCGNLDSNNRFSRHLRGISKFVSTRNDGPFKSKEKDDGTGPSTAPTQSPSPTPQPMTPTPQPLQIIPGALEYMARCISFSDDSDSTDDI